MNTILFGATGYLGSHAAEQLVAAGHDVLFVVRQGSDSSFLNNLLNRASGNQQLSIAAVDFADATALQALLDSAATVINCIAETRMHLSDDDRRKVEVDLTGRLFKAARQAGVKRFIQLSTVMAYGFERPEAAVDENYPCKPVYSYNRIALEREKNLLSLQPQGQTELILFRPSNTLGKRDSSALPAVMKSLAQGKFPVIGGGAWKYSCMDARDVGRALVHLLGVEIQQPEIYLAKGYDITWLDLKAALDKRLGKTSTLQNVPKGLALALGAILEFITPYGKEPLLTRFSATVVSTHTLFDDTKIRKTGFVPRYSLQETLDDALSP